MQDYSHPLGDAIKVARSELGLTQEQVAGKIDADVRTVMNIENLQGKPQNGDTVPLNSIPQN